MSYIVVDVESDGEVAIRYACNEMISGSKDEPKKLIIFGRNSLCVQGNDKKQLPGRVVIVNTGFAIRYACNEMISPEKIKALREKLAASRNSLCVQGNDKETAVEVHELIKDGKSQFAMRAMKG